MRRILWALLALAVAVVGAGALALGSRGVQDAIVTRIAQRRIGRDMSGLLAPDALRVLLCGTASPIPSPRRAEACTAVFAGRSEEHTSELQSHHDLVCRLLLEKKKLCTT